MVLCWLGSTNTNTNIRIRMETEPERVDKAAQRVVRTARVYLSKGSRVRVLLLVFLAALALLGSAYILRSSLLWGANVQPKSRTSSTTTTTSSRRRGNEEVKEILTSSADEVRNLGGGGPSVRAAYATRRGHYADDPGWRNQDSLALLPDFGGSAGGEAFSRGRGVLMGVFDGHGSSGEGCSRVASSEFPSSLSRRLAAGEAAEGAMAAAFLDANAALRRSDVDDSISGTTAVVALLTGAELWVGNVGDSRAVAGVLSGDGSSGHNYGVKAIDLTSDQTPFREDEKIRLRKSGARVQTFDQVSGLKDPTSDSWAEREEDEYDPPRVWPPHSNQMGLAMSRSIGDNLMSQYGVTAQAEVEVRKLDESMAVVIVATDGVWEFMSSQKAVDIALRHKDAREAARAIASRSFKRWMGNDVRSDDITVLVAFLDWGS